MLIESQNQRQLGFKLYLIHPWNLIQTGYLFLTWLVMSWHLELIGPTLPTLAVNINVNYTEMGTVLATRSFGYLITNILGIILQDIVDKYPYIVLICGFILPAIVTFAIPFVTSMILMSTLFFFQGISQSLTDLGGTHILFTMWGINSVAPLNAVRIGYGIGALSANLLVRPFLTQNMSSVRSTSNEVMNSTRNASFYISIPYITTGSLCSLMAIGHLFFSIRELKNKKEKLEIHKFNYGTLSDNQENSEVSRVEEVSSPYSPRTIGHGHFQYGLILCIIFFCYILLIGGNEQTFPTFLFSYLKSDQFNLSNSFASWTNVLYWLTDSIGRLIIAILAVYFSTFFLLNIIWFGSLCLAFTWLIFVWNIGLTSTSLLILGAATGLAMASMFPLSLAFINERLKFTPALIAFLYSGSALGGIIFQKLAGFIMDHNPKHFPTLFIICILMEIVLYVASNLIHFFHHRNDFLKTNSSAIDGAPLFPETLDEQEQQQMTDYLRGQKYK